MLALLAGCSRHASLVLTPASFPECKGPNIVAHIRWDARGKTHDPVKLYVYKIGNPPILWYQGPPKGEQDTGKWFADGSTVLLVDSKGHTLARRTEESTPCGK